MKIAILTLPLNYNYGGILQNYALQTVLKRMGHQVVTLDPIRYYGWWNCLKQAFTWIIGRLIRKPRSAPFLYALHFDNEIRKKGQFTFRFIKTNIQLKVYKDLNKDIKRSSYDAFIVGSDQVWRKEYNSYLPHMFLDFTKDWNVRRLAYAASFGTDEWCEDDEITLLCGEMLRQFNFVSVREDSGIKLCKELFGVKAHFVLDPTLLLSKEDYVSMLQLDKVPQSKGNLLVYILDSTDDKKKLVNQISDDYHLVPFHVNADVYNCGLELSNRIQPPVEQWLRGFMDAEYVVTDSFHACVFSIIFGKPFIVYQNKKRGTTRYQSLLKLFSLEDCMVPCADEYHRFNTNMDNVSSRLQQLRIESIDFLMKGLDSHPL